MIKLGFYGGGYDSIAGKIHLLASEMNRKFKVIGGIFSKNPEKSQQCAKIYNVKHFNHIEEMKKEVDIVVILTPTPNHFNDIKKFLDKDIIIDKPIVATSHEAKELKKLIKNKIVVTHNYSGYPMVREMRELSNNLDILKIEVNMLQESFLKPLKPGYPQEWRKKDLEIPNLMLDLGVHTYHLTKYILGKKFKPIFCEINSFSDLDVIDDALIVAKSGKSICKLSFSKIELGHTNSLSIKLFSKEKSLFWSQDDFENLYLNYFDGKREIINRGNAKYEAFKNRYNTAPIGHPSGYLDAFSNLYDDIYQYFTKAENKCISTADESIDSILFFKEALCKSQKL